MERQPLFYIGEEVILSEDNKTYIVDQIIKGGDTFFDRVVRYKRNTTKDSYGQYGYLLNVSFPCKNQFEGECLWAEYKLKKKNKPSEFSFTELMNNLKCPA